VNSRRTIVIVLALIIAVGSASTALASRADDQSGQAAPASVEPAMQADDPTSATVSNPSPARAEDGVSPTPPSEQAFAASGPIAPREHADQPVPRVPNPQPESPIGPIAYFGDEGAVPVPFGLIVPADQHGGSNGYNASGSLAAAPSCSHRCITKGVAYIHGTDVELVVETNVPAQLFITVVADLDGNGTYEWDWSDSTAFGYTSHSWMLEDLVPGQTYYVMATATDDNLDTDYAWGEFTLP